MNVLCIDIGNTSTHYGVLEGRRVLWEERFPTRLLKASQGAMAQRIEKLKARGLEWEGVAFCAVVPAAAEVLWVQLQGLHEPVFQLTYDDCPGLPVNYPKPEEIGQDRLANAIGAQMEFGTPVVVLDMGTAVTLDVMSVRGGYEGGLIVPGLRMMTDYLHERTALLPALEVEDIKTVRAGVGVGKSTVEAMSVGCRLGFVAMIRALIDAGLRDLRKLGEINPEVVATGGDWGCLLECCGDVRFDPLLTLKGLSEALERRMRGKGFE